MLWEIAAWAARKIGFNRLVTGIYLVALTILLSYSLTVIVDGIDLQYIFGIMLAVLIVSRIMRLIPNQWIGLIITILAGIFYVFVSSSGVVRNFLPDFARMFQESISRGVLYLLISGYRTLILESFKEIFLLTKFEINTILSWFLDIQKPVSEQMLDYIWGFAVVILGTWIAYLVNNRKRPIEGISMPGILLGAGLAYKWESPFILLIFLGISILLIVWNRLMAKESEWESAKLDFPSSMRFDSFFIGLVVGGIIILSAGVLALLPLDYSVQKVYAYTEPIVNVLSEKLEEIGIVHGTTGGSERLGTSIPTLPREHLVGLSPGLSEQIVFEASLASNTNLDSINLPYRYWKVSTYDIYTGSGWKSSELSFAELDEFDSFGSEGHQNQVLIDQNIKVVRRDFNRLVYTGLLLKTNSNGTIAERSRDDDQAQRDIYSIYAANDQYTVRSVIPVISEQSLIAAGGEYPTWILDRFLELPGTVPERVFEAANDLTVDLESNYHKAKAIEGYLQSFPYSLDIPAVPDVPDIVDYFLFELKTGFCDYYASAMVIMARSIGIPSRLVIGFAPGVVSEDGDRVIVTESNAHSWAEIYFPNYGWIPFEPTGGRIDLQGNGLTSDSAALQVEELIEEFPRSPVNFWLIRWTGFIALVVIGVGLIYTSYRRKIACPQELFRLIFIRFMGVGRGLGLYSDYTTTPEEYASAALGRIEQLIGKSSWISRNYQAIQTGVITLVNDYSLSVYGTGGIDRNSKYQVIRLWRRLQIQLVIVILVYHYQNAFSRIRIFASQLGE